MVLQFILGGADSGKARILYDRVVKGSMGHLEQRYPVVVPKQFTMQTQEEIIRPHPRHGIMDIDILSFKRLAHRASENLGVRILVVLGDMRKSMMLRKVAGLKKGGLSLYSGHLEQIDFVGQLKSQISELYQCGITSDILKDMQEEANSPLLTQKFEDLEVIYNGFKEYIESHYITTEEILDILCKELPEWEPLEDSIIPLDGYTGFTPVQYRLVELLLIHAREVVCTTITDSRENAYKESSIQHLSYMSRHVMCRVTSMTKQHGILKKGNIICSRCPVWRYDESSELDFLEQNLYRYSGRTWEGKEEHTRVYKGRSPAGEVACVCSRTEQIIKEEEMRYRDAIVAIGDLPSYGQELAHQFNEVGISYFLDDRKSILENLTAELIRAVSEMVRDFSYKSTSRYLKIELVYDKTGSTEERATTDTMADTPRDVGEADAGSGFGGSREHVEQMVDRSENYVQTLNIRGWKCWDFCWKRQYRGDEKSSLKELNQYRMQTLEPLRPLRETSKVEGAIIVSVMAVLHQFLEYMGLREELEEYRGFFLKREGPGDENLAREYDQVCDRVLELFERLEGLSGTEKTDMKNYIQIPDTGLQGIQMGVVPATVGQVMVGDITRSHLEAMKVLLFVGINEGTAPQKKNGESFSSDRNRTALREMDIELTPTAKEDDCIQKFYLYLATSKPSRQLVLTYAGLTLNGKNQRPSNLMGEVGKLLSGIRTLDEHLVEWPVRTGRDVRELLIQGLWGTQEQGKDDREWEDTASMQLFQHSYTPQEHRDKVRQLMDAAFYSYEERGIGRVTARALYGRELQGSVTRLEQFTSYAYAHFLRYGLELMKRQGHELEAVDMGDLFRQSIDRCFASMKDRRQDWRELTEEGRESLVKECMTQVTKEYGNIVVPSSARNAYLAGRVERIANRTIWALAGQVKKGDFESVGFEVSFSATDSLKAMRIGLPEDERLQPHGCIDRMDLCRDEDHVYTKIIDYESGTASFDLAALFYGSQLQLVVYMDTVMEMEKRRHPDKEVIPAGIFYYHVGNPIANKQRGTNERDTRKQVLKQLGMNGLVNSKLDIIRRLDREIKKEFDVVPVATKDGYVQESRSSVTSTRRFQDLRRFANRRLKEAGQDMPMGNVNLKPYKQGDRTARSYCPHHVMCGFDTKTAGYGYRKLKGLKPEEIRVELESEGDEGISGSESDQ